jgi:hypothetical protein
MRRFYILVGFSFVAGECLLAQTNSTAILKDFELGLPSNPYCLGDSV